MAELAGKLGIKAGMTACAVDLPDSLAHSLPLGPCIGASDVTLIFVRSPEDVAAQVDAAVARFRPQDRLWFAYPKKSGKIAATISRDNGWEALVAHDFLPVTQIALDANWSALRFRPRSEIGKLTRKTDLPGQK